MLYLYKIWIVFINITYFLIYKKSWSIKDLNKVAFLMMYPSSQSLFFLIKNLETLTCNKFEKFFIQDS